MCLPLFRYLKQLDNLNFGVVWRKSVDLSNPNLGARRRSSRLHHTYIPFNRGVRKNETMACCFHSCMYSGGWKQCTRFPGSFRRRYGRRLYGSWQSVMHNNCRPKPSKDNPHRSMQKQNVLLAMSEWRLSL